MPPTFFDVADETEARPVPEEGFERDPRWVIFPKRAYEAHGEIHERLRAMAHDFSADPTFAQFNPQFEGGVLTAKGQPPTRSRPRLRLRYRRRPRPQCRIRQDCPVRGSAS